MIQKRLESLQPYFKGLKVAENYNIVEFILKKSWEVEETDDIQVNQKDVKESASSLYTLFYSDTMSFDDILDYIEEKVINYNLEIEEKERLLKAKVEELKRVFETKSLDELNHLKFTTEGDSLKLTSNKQRNDNETLETEKVTENKDKKLEKVS